MLVDKVIGKVLEVDSSRTTGYKEIATFKNAVMDYNRKKDNQDLSVDDKFNQPCQEVPLFSNWGMNWQKD